MAPPECDLFEVIKFEVKVEGQDELIEVPVKGADEIFMKIPEGSKYTTSVYFKALKPLKKFKYIQIGKKAGITVKKTEKYLGDSFEPREEPYKVEFPLDETPSGFFFRGVCPMTSTYYVDDKEVLKIEWAVEVTKK